MTPQEASEELKEEFEIFKNCIHKEDWENPNEELIKIIEANLMAIEVLEQESKTEQFAKWVAREIFDDDWEYNKDAFAEIACRKLEKLGIVRAKGDEWELINPQESEEL